ncbi:uncharacterized protein LY79DRAFT_579969 [Colletotrichum navitas]|uniref:T6SS Phospholipase effector Tle1-like catalytic domain-containing protein n=1 Tax=Colletotrichum navitas TaxID=681940 RepID=A0AAD8V5U7_9PEZI|nr:uncharacterized protein LY79DRAFT_579969 [Colletotrichum navitas]KAK1590508.1 hypothetical protein LY79DRAFT_579969 [Colletotrichum navitas]
MINNCGIVKPVYQSNDIYRIYPCPSEPNALKRENPRDFRRIHTWALIADGDVTDPPVRFMGIFDTVGKGGIPEFAGSLSVDWLKPHYQHVSSVVSEAYHALLLHERLYALQPCFVSRNTSMGRPTSSRNAGFPVLALQHFKGYPLINSREHTSSDLGLDEQSNQVKRGSGSSGLQVDVGVR